MYTAQVSGEPWRWKPSSRRRPEQNSSETPPKSLSEFQKSVTGPSFDKFFLAGWEFGTVVEVNSRAPKATHRQRLTVFVKNWRRGRYFRAKTFQLEVGENAVKSLWIVSFDKIRRWLSLSCFSNLWYSRSTKTSQQSLRYSLTVNSGDWAVRVADDSLWDT